MQTTLPRRRTRSAAARPDATINKDAALVTLMRKARDRPGDAELHTTIAAALTDLERFEDAIGAGLLATSLAPDSARAQAELGRALFLAGQVEQALDPCARAVTLAPRNVGALVTFGAVLFNLGHMDAALEAAAESVAIDPRHFQARANLALALEAVGRLDEAESQSRQALALNPASAACRHNLAGLRLSRGKLDAESWRLYDARLGLTEEARRLGTVPRWAGEDVAGKTVLLHAEQGFGDVIQFARYAGLVQARGARVVLAVPAPLRRLMGGLAGVDQVVGTGALPRFDVFCPIASLPGVFGTTLNSVPVSVPYLAATPDAVERFRVAASARLQVGLVCAGNPAFLHDRLRSIDAASVQQLADVPGVDFHSLQKDMAPPFPMRDRMAEVSDFADTAGLIANLDLVIAVDTAVAHLAGAMGKPVWVLSRFMGCWRWLRDRSDSPWYPALRIFRQQRPGDWDGVLAEVRCALLERAGRSAR